MPKNISFLQKKGSKVILKICQVNSIFNGNCCVLQAHYTKGERTLIEITKIRIMGLKN